MKVIEQGLPGLLLVELEIHRDDRGSFVELYRRDRYVAAGIPAELVQHSFSTSRRGVLRGMHYQLARPQGKLVTVTRGEVFDVAVDVRRGSPTFGRWAGTWLSAASGHQLWIPPGFAHGFLTLSDEADLAYQCSHPYDPDDERAIHWDDDALAIAWPFARARDPIVSPRDAAASTLADADLPEHAA